MEKEAERNARVREISRRAVIGGAVTVFGGVLLYKLIGEEDSSTVSRPESVGVGNKPLQIRETALVKAPDFQAETVDGKTIRLSDYTGKNVLLFFWQDNFVTGGPEFISKEIRPKFPELQLISVVPSDKSIRVYLDQVARDTNKPIDYPVIFDSNEAFKIISKFKVSGTPAYVILNSKGEIFGHIDVAFNEAKEKLPLLLERLTREQLGQK